MMIRFLSCLMMCAAFLLGGAAYAQAPGPQRGFDFVTFGKLPILHDGRIKPLASYARAQKTYVSGNRRDAVLWLRDSLFNPALAETFPVIKITNPDSLNMLGLERAPDKLYSYRAVNQAFMAHHDAVQSIIDMPQEDWTPAQADIARLQQKLIDLADIFASVSPFLPLAAGVPDGGAADISALPDSLQALAGQDLTYWQAMAVDSPLRQFVQRLAQNRGSAIEGYSPLEQAMVQLAFSLDSLRLNGQLSQSFRVIPAIAADDVPFLTPWQALTQGHANAQQTALFERWSALARAYHDGNAAQWNAALAAIYTQTLDAAGDGLRRDALALEYYSGRIAPVKSSAALYGLALLLMGTAGFIAALQPKAAALSRGFVHAAFFSAVAGAALHIGFLLVRIYILQRPPVSTLFESILFVGALSVCAGLGLYAAKGQKFWLGCGAGLGLLLHILALANNQSGDSLLMLSAVLNTNFWLATHVICITAGYGFCVLVSALAHYILWSHAVAGTQPGQDSHQKMLHVLALIALLFAAVGTVLGGVWADQSWGRFWGWDPKENGALLIVLWLIWVLHGRISAQMKPLAVTAGLAYVSVITALSWFGVNLLNVGLHSYGFTQGLAGGLAGFVGLETALIGGLWWAIARTRNTR